jgi:hypothetical protein
VPRKRAHRRRRHRIDTGERKDVECNDVAHGPACTYISAP